MNSEKLNHTGITVGIIISISYLVFAQTFSSPWLVDDYPVVINNPAITSLSSFFEHTRYLRPLRELSLLVDYQFFGLNPAGYHIQQIFWHALNGILLFHLALRIGYRRPVAWFATLLFLVHPITVEVLANISHRKDNIALAFGLLTIHFYHNALMRKSDRRFAWLLCAIGSYMLGFLAKGNMIVLPAICLVYEAMFFPPHERLVMRHSFWQHRFSARILCSSLLLAFAAWYTTIWNTWSFREAIVGSMLKMESYDTLTPFSYIGMVLKSLAFMFSKLLFPSTLSMEYAYDAPTTLADPWICAGLFILVAVPLGAYFCRIKVPQLSFALAWYAIFSLPTSNLVWHFAYFAADRYQYTPSVGFSLAVAFIISLIFQYRTRLFLLISGLLISILSLLTWMQTSIWNDELRFYSRILEVNPHSKIALMSLVRYYRKHNEPEKAIDLIKRSLNGATQLKLANSADMFSDLGALLNERGKPDQAEKALRTGLEFNPGAPRLLLNLGVLLEQQGRLNEASTYLVKAIASDPGNEIAHYNLGIVYYKQKMPAKAIESFQHAARLKPDNGDTLYNLALTLARHCPL